MKDKAVPNQGKTLGTRGGEDAGRFEESDEKANTIAIAMKPTTSRDIFVRGGRGEQ